MIATQDKQEIKTHLNFLTNREDHSEKKMIEVENLRIDTSEAV